MSIDPTTVAVGDHVWTINHYVVEKINPRDAHPYHLTSEDGKKIMCTAGVLENGFHSVTRFGKEEKISRTAMKRKIDFAGHGDFTVEFTKKIDPGTFAEEVQAAVESGDFGPDAKKRKKWMAKNMKGEARVMQARLFRDKVTNEVATDDAGRIPVYDLEKKGKRLVDARTITSLTFAGTKYTLK